METSTCRQRMSNQQWVFIADGAKVYFLEKKMDDEQTQILGPIMHILVM